MANPTPTVIVKPDADALATAAADLITDAAAAAIRDRGRFLFVLAGGSTPEKTYTLLAKPDRASKIDWSKTLAFMGDERFVPFDDPRSNFGMARRTLLSKVPIPPGNVYPVDTSLPSAAAAAEGYFETIARVLALHPPCPVPRFDLILLGLGDDGHTLSLFPGHPTLNERDAWVIPSPPGTLPPPVDRITFTFPVANAARAAVFTVSGEKKAEPLRAILEGNAPVHTHPAAGIRPKDGTLTFLIDAPAASKLSRKT